jgi:hypothetical protein
MTTERDRVAVGVVRLMRVFVHDLTALLGITADDLANTAGHLAKTIVAPIPEAPPVRAGRKRGSLGQSVEERAAAYVPYGVPALVVQYLERQPAGSWVPSAVVARAVGAPPKQLTGLMRIALRYGAVQRSDDPDNTRGKVWAVGHPPPPPKAALRPVVKNTAPPKATVARAVPKGQAARLLPRREAKLLASVPVHQHIVVGAPRTQGPARADLPVVVPDGLQVQVCPSPADWRFKIDPATFQGGELTVEWQRLRGARA